jgi:hypothetical protein
MGERRWYGYRSMVFKYNSLAGWRAKARISVLRSRFGSPTLPCTPLYTVGPVFADYDQPQVFFRPRESGCERDLAIRVERQGAVKLKLKTQ